MVHGNGIVRQGSLQLVKGNHVAPSGPVTDRGILPSASVPLPLLVMYIYSSSDAGSSLRLSKR